MKQSSKLISDLLVYYPLTCTNTKCEHGDITLYGLPRFVERQFEWVEEDEPESEEEDKKSRKNG